MVLRLLSFLVALDVLLLSLFTLGGSKRGETISAAAWSLERDGKLAGVIGRPLIDALIWFDPHHCRRSWVVAEKIRRALEPNA